MRDAKSLIRDAEYYVKQKKYDRARAKYRDAANAMDNYQSRLSSARNAASRSEDYLRKAADALR